MTVIATLLTLKTQAMRMGAIASLAAISLLPSGAIAAEDFVVTSPAIEENGFMPSDFSCEGDSQSMPLAWANPPAGTKYFALSLWSDAPDKVKSYWLLYNIPADVSSLAKGSLDVGVFGLNTRSLPEYQPMCAKRTAPHTFTLSFFALSEEAVFETDQVTRDMLLEGIKDITLAEYTFPYQFGRTAVDGEELTLSPPPPGPPPAGSPPPPGTPPPPPGSAPPPH